HQGAQDHRGARPRHCLAGGSARDPRAQGRRQGEFLAPVIPGRMPEFDRTGLEGPLIPGSSEARRLRRLLLRMTKEALTSRSVMVGHSPPKTVVDALCPCNPRRLSRKCHKTWMPGIMPG